MKKVIELILGLVIGLVIGCLLGSITVTPAEAHAETVAPPAEVQAIGAPQAPEGSEAWASVTETRTREALAWTMPAGRVGCPCRYQNEDIMRGDSVPMLKILTLNSTTV